MSAMDQRAERAERDAHQRATLWAHTYTADQLDQWRTEAETRRDAHPPTTRHHRIAAREADMYARAQEIQAEGRHDTWEAAADAAGIPRAR